jgi:hypothetical protein
VKGLNLGLKFVLELAAIAALANWGATLGSGAAAWLGAGGAALLAMVLWGTFAAPKAKRRLPRSARIPFELTVFALAAVGLAVAASTTLAIVFAVVALVNFAGLVAFDQLDE